MNDLFNVDIESLNEQELIEWIKACRNFVDNSSEWRYSNRNKDHYQQLVMKLLDDWEQHYNENTDFYNSDKYKRAILLAGLQEDVVRIKNRDGDVLEYPATDFFKKLSAEDAYKHSKQKTLDDYYDFYTTNISTATRENYRSNVASLIERVLSNYEYDFYLDDEDLLEKSIDEIVACLKAEDVDKAFASLHIANSTKVDLLIRLYDFDIARQQYYNYVNVKNKRGMIVQFEKKLILNLALLFSLPWDLFEQFLQMHGFSIANSFEDRDYLMLHLLKFGVSKEYIDVAVNSNKLPSLNRRIDEFRNRDHSFNMLMNYLEKIKKHKASYTDDEVKKLLSADEYAQYARARDDVKTHFSAFISYLEKKISRQDRLIAENNEKQVEKLETALEKAAEQYTDSPTVANKQRITRLENRIHNMKVNRSDAEKKLKSIMSKRYQAYLIMKTSFNPRKFEDEDDTSALTINSFNYEEMKRFVDSL